MGTTPPKNPQAEWELFSDDYNPIDTRFGIRCPATPAIDQVEDIDEDLEEEDHGALLPLSRPQSHSDDNVDLIWSSTATTPTQTPSSFLSSFFGSTPATSASGTMTATTPARQGISPSSSPRLPSPPPFTEVQIGPKSPSIGKGFGEQLEDEPRHDDGSNRRIRPGTKAAEMASGPPLVPLAQLDSPFQLQEHLKALYHTYTKSTDNTNTPIARESAMALATPPEGIDRQLWLYELCRFLTMKANHLIIAFFAENPPCSSTTCPEMRASEWQYLCAVHDPPKSCCAIDYCCHTLDWATNILTSPKYFPSRLTLGNEAAGGSAASMRHLTNIFRRVYRIFAHAWFQHRGVFWQVEGHDGLYIFFKTVCDVYQLIPEDNYTIPAEAEGTNQSMETPISLNVPEYSILKNEQEDAESNGTDSSQVEEGQPTTAAEPNTMITTGQTTRRHKHTPSTGTNVTMIAEGDEEETTENGTGHGQLRDPNTPAENPPAYDGNTETKESEGTVTNGMAKLSIAPEEGKDTSKAAETADEDSHSTDGTNSTEESEGQSEQRESETQEEPTVIETQGHKMDDPVGQRANNTADAEERENVPETEEDAAT